MEPETASTCLDALSQTPGATERVSTPSTTYAALDAQPRFLNSGTSAASYQPVSADNTAHQCIQCFQCNQCHQCGFVDDVDCSDKTKPSL